MKHGRRHNGGLRKRCGCPRKVWPKCPHSWHFNYKPRGGAPLPDLARSRTPAPHRLEV